jgi:hypothetical protein
MYNYYPTVPNVFPTQSNVFPTQTEQIQYVNGKQSAESYQMSPNSSVILMDSEKARFYVKKTDASGIATIKAYDFTESDDDKPMEYVTKAEFEKFKASVKGARHESSNDANRKQ